VTESGRVSVTGRGRMRDRGGESRNESEDNGQWEGESEMGGM
jgi:hypothetical protein